MLMGNNGKLRNGWSYCYLVAELTHMKSTRYLQFILTVIALNLTCDYVKAIGHNSSGTRFGHASVSADR